MDTRIIPSENVSSDHRMVVATLRKEIRISRIVSTFQTLSVNIKKLKKPDINMKYQENISYKLAQLPNKLNSAEKEWIDFKDVIQGTAEQMVVQKKSGGQQKKATAWWNEETRQATKLKKMQPIWKRKGVRRECSQYRGISQLSQPSKVFARILEKRIRYRVEQDVAERSNTTEQRTV